MAGEVLADYAGYVEGKLQASLAEKKVIASSDLLNSLQTEIITGSATELAKLVIGFEPYGRLQEMKELNYDSKQAPVDDIAEWIKTKGINSFRLTKRYKQVLRRRGQDAATQDLAWAMVYRKKNPIKKKRRKRWFNTIFFGTISTLRGKLAQQFVKEDLLKIQELFDKQVKMNF